MVSPVSWTEFGVNSGEGHVAPAYEGMGAASQTVYARPTQACGGATGTNEPCHGNLVAYTTEVEA